MNPGQFIQWQDLFVLVDDGAIPVARYGPLEAAVRDQAKVYPGGVACLIILPPDAKPPPDDVKRTVKSLLLRLGSSISCLAYAIEGTGFKGVAARATLVSMKIFSSRRYPIYVETSVPQALGKVFQHLVNGKTTSIDAVLKTIAVGLAWRTPPAQRSATRDSELTVK